jgi:hypothetical protein
MLKMANNATHVFSPEKAPELRIFRISVSQFSRDYKVECRVNGRSSRSSRAAHFWLISVFFCPDAPRSGA